MQQSLIICNWLSKAVFPNEEAETRDNCRILFNTLDLSLDSSQRVQFLKLIFNLIVFESLKWSRLVKTCDYVDHSNSGLNGSLFKWHLNTGPLDYWTFEPFKNRTCLVFEWLLYKFFSPCFSCFAIEPGPPL